MAWARRPAKTVTEALPASVKTPPIESMYVFWHPNREGVGPAPDAFKARLKEIDPDLAAVYSPYHQRWLIWVKNPRIQHWLCRGWHLLFVWEHVNTRERLPLNELVFHNLYYISQERWGSARAYFDRIDADIARQKAQKEKRYHSDRKAQQKELTDSWKISSAGQGNRSALHHDGTMVPSPGELAWRQETAKTRLPSEMVRAHEEEKERREYS